MNQLMQTANAAIQASESANAMASLVHASSSSSTTGSLEGSAKDLYKLIQKPLYFVGLFCILLQPLETSSAPSSGTLIAGRRCLLPRPLPCGPPGARQRGALATHPLQSVQGWREGAQPDAPRVGGPERTLSGSCQLRPGTDGSSVFSRKVEGWVLVIASILCGCRWQVSRRYQLILKDLDKPIDFDVLKSRTSSLDRSFCNFSFPHLSRAER